MNEFLILPKDNYLSALPLDIVAFHFSEPGACGYHGVLRIITRDKRKFMVQYFHDDWDEVDLYKVCPVLEATHIGFAGYNVTPLGWDSVYMGLGNTLFFINELQPLLHEKCKNMAPVEIYNNWCNIILEYLQ